VDRAFWRGRTVDLLTTTPLVGNSVVAEVSFSISYDRSFYFRDKPLIIKYYGMHTELTQIHVKVAE
jgi:hypothetical protein